MELKKRKKHKKVKLLVSFKSKQEVSRENLKFVDILDLKDPALGALGSWKIESIREIIKTFGEKKEISATLGDIKNINYITKKLTKFDELKLNYIKFGLFSENQNQIENLLKVIFEKKIKTKLVPVIFADCIYTKNWVFKNFEKIKFFGFNYILLDTFSKKSGDLLELCSLNFLKKLIEKSSKFNIKIGLAGKLKSNQIPKLLKLNPSILGFRSAVCMNNNRNSKISNFKIKELHSFLNAYSFKRFAIHKAGA